MTNETPATIRPWQDEETITTLRARLAEAEKAQHYWHQKWEAEREKSRRLVECVRGIARLGEARSYPHHRLLEALATVSDLTAAAAAEDEVKS